MKPVLKEWFIDAPWGKIALISWGNPKGSPVLLVHGRQDSAATFVPLLQLLPGDLHYVALDLPGHGLSDPFPKGTALTRMHFVTPVELVVQHLKWKSFTYLSHSMGGEIGLFYNAARPHRIKKFIHLDVGVALQTVMPKPWVKFFEVYDNYYNNYENFNANEKRYTRARALEAVMKARGVSAELAELLLSRNLRPAPAEYVVAVDEADIVEEQFTLSWDKRLKNLANLNITYEHLLHLFTTNAPPTLFIAASDSVSSYGSQSGGKFIQDMAKRIPIFRYVEVAGSHDVHLTHPERIADDVVDFLRTKFHTTKSKL
ncbi:alpha/beta hydrolase fold domain-containing protein [Phthorimaea operculella]|nr:alpha/beta hydrolase fold domain-containing protein [Phthorimaea operculella]